MVAIVEAVEEGWRSEVGSWAQDCQGLCVVQVLPRLMSKRPVPQPRDED